MTSTPPPPGRCTSSRTTSGWCSAIAATASSTSAASARMATTPAPEASSSARTPRRNIAWSSTITTLTGACSLIAVLLSGPAGLAGQVQAHLGPLTDRGPHLGGPAVPVHAVDDAHPDAVPVGGDVRLVEPVPAVADEHGDRGGRHRGVHVDAAGGRVLGGVGHGLPAGRHDGAQGLVDVAVSHCHDVHRDAVRV